MQLKRGLALTERAIAFAIGVLASRAESASDHAHCQLPLPDDVYQRPDI